MRQTVQLFDVAHVEWCRLDYPKLDLHVVVGRLAKPTQGIPQTKSSV
jgi:hypothetical protein